MKLAKLNVKAVGPEAFVNYRSYLAGKYAIDIVNQMITRANRGDIIFEYENIVRPEFRLDFNDQGVFTGLSLKDGENCCVTIVGDVTDTDTGLIVCTKRDIREFFKLWRVATITNVNKVSDLTK